MNIKFNISVYDTGIKKKLEAKAKKKASSQIKRWIPSINSHVYWCANSSKGNSDLLVQKWKSILNHVCNIHEGHGDLYTKCEHGDLTKDWILRGNIFQLKKKCKITYNK